MSVNSPKRLALYIDDRTTDGKLIQRWADKLSEDCHGLDILIIPTEGYPRAVLGPYTCSGPKQIKLFLDNLRKEHQSTKFNS